MTQQSDPNSIANSLPWQEISGIINSEEFKTKFTTISTETLEFCLMEENYQSLVEAALKSLKLSDSEKANLEQAAQVADKMRRFASQMLVERKSN